MRKISALLGSALFALLLGIPGVARSDPHPSTAAEREEALKNIRLLEANPLSEKAGEIRASLVGWIMELTDIKVSICEAFLGDMVGVEERHGDDLFMQVLFSQVGHLIEHPDQMQNEKAKYLAGLQGALTAYKNILKTEPASRWESMDRLVKMQEANSLEAYVEDNYKKCETSEEAH